jgi:WD40 repeat protein
VTVAALIGGFAAVVQGRRASQQALVADARRLGAQALVEQDLARALLMAREGVRLNDSAETRSNLLATLQRSPRAIGIVQTPRARPQSIAVSGDGRMVAVGDNMGTLHWWDAGTLRSLGKHETGRPGAFFGLAFLPDGRLAAVHSSPEAAPVDLLVLDTATGKVLHAPYDRLPAEAQHQVRSLVVDQQGTVLIPVNEGVLAWHPDNDTMQLFRTPTPPVVVALASKAQTLAATLADGTVAIVDRESGMVRPIGSVPTPVALTIDISPDGQTVATLTGPAPLDPGVQTAGGGVALWSADGRPVGTVAQQSSPIISIEFSGDGTRLLTTADDHTGTVWDVTTGRRDSVLRGHGGRMVDAVFAPDDRTVWSAGYDESVIHWDLTGVDTMGPAALLPVDTRDVTWVAPSANRRHLVVGTTAGEVLVWDVAEDQLVAGPWQNHSGTGETAHVRGGSVSVTGLVASTGNDHMLVVRRLDGTVVMRRLLNRDELPDVTFSPDGSLLAVSGGDQRIELIDPLTGDMKVELDVRFLPAMVAFSPDGNRLAVTTWQFEDEIVKIFDTRSGELVRELALDTPAMVARFSPDGRLLATGSDAGHVRLWDAHTFAPLGAPLTGHTGFVISIAFSPDGRTLASAGDGSVVLWDVQSRRRVGGPLTDTTERPSIPYNYATFDPSGRTVVVVDRYGMLRRWSVDPTDWAERACRVANRQLTRAEWTAVLPNRPYRPVCP